MAKDKKLRVAVLGAGSIAKHRHLPEYAARPDVEIVALVDLNKDRAKGFAEKYNIPNVFRDYRDALKLRPDAVSVCTPNAFHALHTLAALKAKAHVLCEKPMAISLPEARKMIASAKAHNRQLMIGHNQRLAPGHVFGRDLYQSGVLGKCINFRTTFAHGGPEFWSADGLNCHFFKKKLTVFGTLADLGVHKIDLIRWMLGEDIVQVSAMYDTLVKKNCNVDDSAVAVFRTASGALGQMYAGWGHNPGCDNSTVLYCEKGILRIGSDPVYTVIVELADGERQMIKTKALQSNEEGGQTDSGVMATFVECTVKGKPCQIPGEEGAQSMAVILACLESAETKRFVAVNGVLANA